MPNCRPTEKHHPLVSICIANFNGESILTECIESVRAQQAYADCEIIVHDDASTDASVDLIRTTFPDARLIVSEQNVGFCVANNRMVEMASGKYILLLNNDAALLPDAISSLIGTAESQEVGGILTLPQYDWVSGELVDRGCFLDPFYNAIPSLSPGVNDVGYVIGACLWIPRSLWQRIGGFPEWMGSIGEDVYVGCVTRLLDLPVRSLDSSGYLHRQGASFGGNRVVSGKLESSYRRRFLGERNRLCLQLCCTPGWSAWPMTIVHATALLLEGMILAVWLRDSRPLRKIYIAAILGFLGLRAQVSELRRQIQALRKINVTGYLRGFRFLPQKLRLLRRHGKPDLVD
ncbi:MAG: glycosyltransferase family 2 protein [Rhodanobacteraceae bacterium]|nr:glycosyltransferase family 2 protein [Rhodanobacteraceae bacterium]